MQEGEENFELCERYALSNLWHHRFLSVDSHAVRRSVDGVITKFEIHGHRDSSIKLRQLIDTFLASDVFKDHPQVSKTNRLYTLIMLKRREECDTYLTHVCRHHCSGENPVKR